MLLWECLLKRCNHDRALEPLPLTTGIAPASTRRRWGSRDRHRRLPLGPTIACVWRSNCADVRRRGDGDVARAVALCRRRDNETVIRARGPKQLGPRQRHALGEPPIKPVRVAAIPQPEMTESPAAGLVGQQRLADKLEDDRRTALQRPGPWWWGAEQAAGERLDVARAQQLLGGQKAAISAAIPSACSSSL